MLRLLKDGHQVTAITRSVARATRQLGADITVVAWSDSLGIQRALEHSDGVIHLAGEPIADRRWTQRQKRTLWDSRVKLTQTLVKHMQRCTVPPKVLISASAVGFYGQRSKPVDESSAAGKGFTSRLAVAWEAAAQDATDLGVRVVQLRLGLVLARSGAFRIMDAAYRRGLGARVGSGTHGACWIHLADVLGLIEWALHRQDIHGPLNATAPNSRTQQEVHADFSTHYGRQWSPAIPGFLVRLALGERARLLTHGAVVDAHVALSQGYSFLFPTLTAALTHLTNRKRYQDIQFETCLNVQKAGGQDATYVLMSSTRVGAPLSQVAPWFETPHNLTLMTPPFMRFKILQAENMAENAMLSYQIDLFGFPMKWTSKIPVFEPGVRFVDTQVRGPYRLWWHEHRYQSDGEETWVYDTVHYTLPLGVLGRIAHALWVKPTLRRIFEYRTDTMHERFGHAAPTPKRISA